MKSEFYRQIIAMLIADGFEYWRPAKGSHELWKKLETGRVVTVPRNLKSRHTANGILKSAGIDQKL